MFIIATHTVTNLDHDIRLYDYANQIFKVHIPSRKGIKKALKRGEIFVDNVQGNSGDWVKNGQVIELRDLELSPPKPYPLSFDIVFEDDFMAVINKPAGIPVSGNQHRTIQNAIIGQLTKSNQPDALKWPRPVHRLDSQTSGLLIIAKTANAIIHLSKQFEHRESHKTYHALLMGKPKSEELINMPINNLASKTHLKTLKTVNSIKSGTVSLVQLTPHTGRTHQLRIHCAEIGCPILGDKLYGQEGNTLKHKGLFLCATKISLKHPSSNEWTTYSISTPEKFHKRLVREQSMFDKLN